MVASDPFAEFVHELLTPLGSITMRRMFGKTGVFCDGLMLGMESEDTLYFRVDDHNREAFREAASSAPLRYQKQGRIIDLSFWPVPERLLDESDAFLAWAHEALAAARRVAVKRGGALPPANERTSQDAACP
jgi:DNA transformation protein